ncbi:hydroxyacylglutathione hydrolase [Methanofollis sp. W23]|uniref:MBL fold metallo-hydrolase n=1 Tax=Methanofollis sp. W23 TaxID=2817849 RepID=UPI001AE2397F|nr:rhodanese-like domain-containing protein [Methanofollis sp. W23]MBP2145296.1 hydroxyacylglutathione hydrolase [Methanofollis sp. W23]
MIFEQIESTGLAHYSYFVGAGRAAAVVDPRRDVEVYLDLADAHGVEITHIFETHRNEDYCTGSLDLARATGAEILHGVALDFGFGRPVKEGEVVGVGPLEVRVLETPGHTDESISLVLAEAGHADAPLMVFTGDALFAGDVGRTDFFKDRLDEMAGALYDSLHEKILTLHDGVIVCPAHGAGSVCGGTISDRPLTTVGHEKRTNPLLQLNRPEFVARKRAEHHPIPPYFATMERYNLSGPLPLRGGETTPMRPMPPDAIEHAAARGATLVDLRGPSAFAGGHVPGSLNIWQAGVSAYLGYYARYDRAVIFIDDVARAPRAAATQARRLGFDAIDGYLAGGMRAWYQSGRPIGRCKTCSVHEVDPDAEGQFIIDVRDRPTRLSIGAVPGSHSIPVEEIARRIREVPRHTAILAYCNTGFKGSLAASILLRDGYQDVTNILGGMNAWINTGRTVQKEPRKEEIPVL